MSGSGFEIDDVLQLKWLLLVAVCAAAMVYGFALKDRAMRAFGSLNLMKVLAPDVSRPRQYVKAALVLAAMASIVLALVGPRLGTYWEDIQQRQLDLVVCLDVSKSMLAEDAGMSRLDRAKDDIKRLLERLGGGLIGIICFAGRAELTCPLTDDYEFVRLAIDDIGIHSAPLGGTNIGEAIAAAQKALGDRKAHHRAVLVLTDGEDHGKTALAQAEKAHKEGIAIYTIGIGDEERGGLVPVEKDGRRTYMMYDGQQLWSKMDPTTLKQIAQAGGGEYQPSRQVNSRQRTLEWIYTERLAPQEERSMKEKRVPRKHARFAWPAALALLLLMIESLMSERRAGTCREQSRDDKGGLSGVARARASSAAALVFALTVSVPAFAQTNPPAADDLRAAAKAVKEGNKLLDAGNFAEALAKYEEARSKAPDAPEVAYDRGLAHYRLNQFGEAAAAFQDAIKPGQPELEARAKYNLGRCAHAEALGRKEDLAAAVNDLGKAITFYNDALQIAPQDVDAQTNKAAAERLMAFLQKKLEQQKKEKQPSSQPTSQPKDEPTSQPQEKQPSSQPSSQPQDEKQEGEQKEGDEQEQKEGEEDKKDEPKPGDKKKDQEKQQGPANEKPREGGEEEQTGESQQQPGDQKEHELTAEEAEPMLQEARDAERQRRETKRMRIMRIRGRVPVDKDW